MKAKTFRYSTESLLYKSRGNSSAHCECTLLGFLSWFATVKDLVAFLYCGFAGLDGGANRCQTRIEHLGVMIAFKFFHEQIVAWVLFCPVNE